MVRFMTKGSEHGECGVIVNRFGVDITDPVKVEQLRNSPNNGTFFFEVEDERQLRKANRKKQDIVDADFVRVPPITGILTDEEMQAEVEAVAENERLKQEPVEEDDIWAEPREVATKTKGKQK